MLKNVWQQRFLWKNIWKYLMHVLSCYQATLLLYMASKICTLINLIYAIPLYLKFGLRAKTFGLLLTTFHGRRIMMQMQNHTHKKTELKSMLNQKHITKILASISTRSRLICIKTQCPTTSVWLISFWSSGYVF